MKTRHALLAGILAATAFAAIADDAPGLDSNWMLMLNTHTYKAFYGASTQTSENPFAGTMWNRIDYAVDQGGPVGAYKTVVFLVKFGCADHKAAIVRTVKYSGKKAVVSDSTTPDASLQWVDVKAVPPKDMEAATVFAVARVDYESTCEKGE
jgi:hypothetical protein